MAAKKFVSDYDQRDDNQTGRKQEHFRQIFALFSDARKCKTEKYKTAFPEQGDKEDCCWLFDRKLSQNFKNMFFGNVQLLSTKLHSWKPQLMTIPAWNNFISTKTVLRASKEIKAEFKYEVYLIFGYLTKMTLIRRGTPLQNNILFKWFLSATKCIFFRYSNLAGKICHSIFRRMIKNWSAID